MWPVEVPAQELYTADTTRNHRPGTVGKFVDSDGRHILARYCKNDAGATLAAGLAVAGAGRPGEIGGSFATNTPIQLLLGGLCASLATNAYGWVIFQGLQTNASASASTASSAGDRVLGVGGVAGAAGNLAVMAATLASTTAAYTAGALSVAAYLQAGDALAAAASNSVYWIWR